MTKISIIVPIYNQAPHLNEVVHRYKRILDDLEMPYEMLLVSNGCSDNSPELCRAFALQYREILHLNLEKGGWGRAVRAGIQASSGEIICYTNSARTKDYDLGDLVKKSLANPECVIKANRKIRDGILRRLGSLIYNLECRALFDLSYWDINGTPKVFHRKLSKLLELTRDDDLIDLEFCIVCRRSNYPLLEVPIFSSQRYGGVSTTNLFSAYNMYKGALSIFISLRSEK